MGCEEVHLLPDTHAHLDANVLSDDLEAVVSRACGAGVDRILAVGEDLVTSRRAAQIAANYDIVFAAVGIHPHRANQFDEERREVERLLDHEKVVAVGEIGLDWVRCAASRETQDVAFRVQLQWATERSMPVSVHNRGADDKVLAVLGEFQPTTVMHCFSGSWNLASQALAAGYYLSFAGNVTFKRADELRAVAQRIPLNRLLVETDSPVLAPQSHRGKRNEPAQIIETASVIAALRGVSLEVLSAHIARNASDVFGWSTP